MRQVHHVGAEGAARARQGHGSLGQGSSRRTGRCIAGGKVLALLEAQARLIYGLLLRVEECLSFLLASGQRILLRWIGLGNQCV